MGQIVGIMAAVMRRTGRQHEPLLFVDLNAGPGRCINTACKHDAPCGGKTTGDRWGSPMIAMYLLRDALGDRFDAHFCESDPEIRSRLAASLESSGERFTIHDRSVFVGASQDQRWTHGLVYADPSNATIDDELLRQYAQQYQRVDILINFACTSHKRRVNGPDYEHLHRILARIPKKIWLIRRPVGRHQWAMFYGLNWEGAKPPARDWVRFDSAEGREVFARLNYTQKERQSAYSSYAEYLRHPKFRAVRKIAMERARWRCRCGARATEVHHDSYPPWGTFDKPEDLMPVCHACHCEIHGKDN